MTTSDRLSFSGKIKWRIRLLWLSLILLFIYAVVASEMGFGDQRIMTASAAAVSRIIFFGGAFYIICRIIANKKLLRDQWLMKETLKEEMDEHRRYLHDKSGGIVWNILLICLLFVTLTASLINMPAFYTAFSLLCIAVIIKSAAYLWYSFHG